MNRLLATFAVLGLPFAPTAALAQGDARALSDPTRPVCALGRDFATLQWFTRTPQETRVQVRTGTAPSCTLVAPGRTRPVWSGSGLREMRGTSGKRTWHRLTISGLRPGTRTYYRVWDPGSVPTTVEKTWGAGGGWRREYAFCTLSTAGKHTVIRVPIKVLLMPNVVNVASAHLADGTVIPPPARLTKQQIDLIRREYKDSELFLFISNHMRVWFDYDIVIDDRPQRWGGEPAKVDPAYAGWPVSRAYAGVDFAGPGGGDFTIVDTRAPTRSSKAPVFGEPILYAGQVEQAFVRKWDPGKSQWVFYNSGGGTYGMDEWPRGIPGRSQYLGGGDTAWLATHEYHHQIESMGAFSLSNREDDRVIFDHFAPRKRVKRADGSWDEWAWSTSFRHGEHYDGIACFDRMVNPLQWLRLMWGEPMSVADADGDGVPDDNPRLPFDEKRFGSDPRKAMTDGRMGDLAKAQLSNWAPYQLTTSWDKAPQPRVRTNPRKADSDGDGLADVEDPEPLFPWAASAHGVLVTYKQGHDDGFYYACFRLKGPWARASVAWDPEGLGYYTTDKTYACDIVNGVDGAPPTVRITSGNKCPSLAWKSAVSPDGTAVIELSVQNRGDSLWFWNGGGREVGTQFSLVTRDRKPLVMYEPYRFFFARMLERTGRAEMPPGAPGELTDGPKVRSFDFATGSAAGWDCDSGWPVRDGVLRHQETDGENAAVIAGLDVTEFDFWAEFEAANDFHMGGWAPGTKPGSETDYVAFLGGFGNARSVIRLFGQESGADDIGIPPGRHTMQLTRRAKQVWLLLDGKPIAWAPDPSPALKLDRVGFIGGWGGAQTVYRARLRAK